jgi:YD repeat-containing protein
MISGTQCKIATKPLSTATMRDGQVVNYAYDAIGRVSALSGALTQGFTYNNFGMVTSHTNNGRYANYSYNSLGWLLSVANDNAGALTISYSYDAYGRRTTMTYPSGYVLGYGYNDGDELTALLDITATPYQLRNCINSKRPK